MATSQLDRTVTLLNRILEVQLSGVIRYTNYSLMVSGRDRLSFCEFFTQQANASLQSGQETGRILMAMNERPDLSSVFSAEPQRQSTQEVLLRSLNHERQLLYLHRLLLQTAQSGNRSLEDFATRALLTSESSCRRLSTLLGELEELGRVHVYS